MSCDSIVNTVKSQLKSVLPFLRTAFEVCITIVKDLWNAFKFARTSSDNKSEWWNGIKRNWWKSIRCIGFIFVFFGLNLNLGTIVFVFVSLVARGIIISRLDKIKNTIEINENESNKLNSIQTKSSKIQLERKYTIHKVLQFLIPVIVLFACVAHWWLLLPGLLMMCVGNLVDRIKGNKSESNVSSREEDQNDKVDKLESEKNIGFISDKIGNKFSSFVWSKVAKSVLDNVKNFATDYFSLKPNKEEIDNNKYKKE